MGKLTISMAMFNVFNSKLLVITRGSYPIKSHSTAMFNGYESHYQAGSPPELLQNPPPGCVEEFADEAQLGEGGHDPGVARDLPETAATEGGEPTECH